jgi:hypothetical protein
MSGRQRRPGDPYEVGFGKPPKSTRFKKGQSGNPYGRPRKKPDLYSALKRVLNETVTVTVEGDAETLTVQQALLLRLRQEALHGEIWAGKLLQKVFNTIPDKVDAFDHIEQQVVLFRAKALLRLMVEDRKQDESSAGTEACDGDGR